MHDFVAHGQHPEANNMVHQHGTSAWCISSPRAIFGGPSDVMSHFEEQSVVNPIIKTFERTTGCNESPRARHVSSTMMDSPHIHPAATFAQKERRAVTSSHHNNDNIPGTQVEHFLPMDILPARIGKDHPGTKLFDDTVVRNLQAYQDQIRRSSRSVLIKKVAGDLLAQGCRFLKFEKRMNRFVVLDEKQIRDRVSFAFRRLSIKLESSPCGSTSKKQKNRLLQSEEQGTKSSATSKSSSPCNSPSSVLTAASPDLTCCWKCYGATAPPLGDFSLNEKSTTTQTPTECPTDNDGERDFIEMIEELDAGDLDLDQEEKEQDVTLDIVGYELPEIDLNNVGSGSWRKAHSCVG